MRSTNVDKVAMLLSTDWFEPFWPMIGIAIPRENRVAIKSFARGILERLMQGGSDYWQVSFSDARISGTQTELFEVLSRYVTDQQVLDRIRAICEGRTTALADSKDSWLLESLTEMLFTDAEDRPLSVGGPTMATLRVLWSISKEGLPDLRRQCLESPTKWDSYVRGLTPDLPGLLADFALQEVIAPDRFLAFWTQLSLEVDEHDRHALLSWFEMVGSDLTGEKIDLTRLHAC